MPRAVPWAPILGTLLSALLGFLCAPHLEVGEYFAWFALLPWLPALERVKSPRQAVALGALLSFGFTVLVYSWGAFALHAFAGLPWVLSGAALALVAPFCQLQFWAFGLLYWWSRRVRVFPGGTAVRNLFLAAAYTGFDAYAPKLFPDTLAHGFFTSPIFRQAAELGGAHLLTFLVALTSLALREAYPLRRRGVEAVRVLAAPGVLTVALFVFGSLRVSAWEKRIAEAPKLHAAVVQANVASAEKRAAVMGIDRAADEALDRYLSISKAALAAQPRPELLVWPETAFPHALGSPFTPSEAARERRLKAFMRTIGAPFILGGYDYAGGRKVSNAFFHFPDPSNGERRDVYRKHILLAFGERIPGEQWFPWLRSMLPFRMPEYEAGPGPAVFTVPAAAGTVRALPLICYEAIFPGYVRDGIVKGSANLIVNLTNDAWFGPYGEPKLHLALSAFRSIEARIPQLRVTNTGITTLVLPDGRLVDPTEIGSVLWRAYDIPFASGEGNTLFLQWGDWLPRVSLGLMLLGFMFRPKRRRRR